MMAFLAGCISVPSQYGGEEWPMPSQPISKTHVITPVAKAIIEDDGFYISRENAGNLVDNINELKAYIEKLEVLIKEMKDYYKAK